MIGPDTPHPGALALPIYVLEVLRGARVDLSGEKAAQADVAAALARAMPRILVEREVRLSERDVIDVLVGGCVGVEVKLRAQKAAVWRQLRRYAASPRLTALVLVTNTAMGLPSDVDGVPAYYVSLGRAWL